VYLFAVAVAVATTTLRYHISTCWYSTKGTVYTITSDGYSRGKRSGSSLEEQLKKKLAEQMKLNASNTTTIQSYTATIQSNTATIQSNTATIQSYTATIQSNTAAIEKQNGDHCKVCRVKPRDALVAE
jgi:hypothetical protein